MNLYLIGQILFLHEIRKIIVCLASVVFPISDGDSSSVVVLSATCEVPRRRILAELKF